MKKFQKWSLRASLCFVYVYLFLGTLYICFNHSNKTYAAPIGTRPPFYLYADVLNTYPSVKLPLQEEKEIKIEEPAPEVPEAKEVKIETKDDVIKRIASEYNLDWKILKSICLVESGCEPGKQSPINKNGTRDYGYYQFNSIHKISKENADNLDWATRWTAERINRYAKRGGINYAIQCHNSCGANNGYLGKVLSKMKTF